MYGDNFYGFYNWGLWGHGLKRKANAELLDTPPTLYWVMRSIVDHGKIYDEMTNVKELCEKARVKIFYKNYPLSENINREIFETEILENFIERRIAFDTVAIFQVKLINRLNTIMPKYNLMFDLLAKELGIFTDTEEKIREMNVKNKGNWQTDTIGNTETKDNVTDKTEKENTETVNTAFEQQKNTLFSEGKSGNESVTGEKETIRNGIDKKKYSDTPQNRLSDIDNGTYVSEYTRTDNDVTEGVNYSENKDYREDKEGSNKESVESGEEKVTVGNESIDYVSNKEGTIDTTGKDTNEHEDKTDTEEKITTKTTKDLFLKLKQFEEYAHIKEMIYNDLECLFLQII